MKDIQAKSEELSAYIITRDWVWKTAEGILIPIAEMTDSHLLNTIRCLRGKSPLGTKIPMHPVTRRQWLNAMANEAYARRLDLDELDEDDPVHE